MAVEAPAKPTLADKIYDKMFHNYVWKSIFRTGYPNTPRNQMLVVATNVFLHLHPTRIHRTHVKITHTYCLGGLSFFMFLGLTVTGILLMFYYVPERRQSVPGHTEHPDDRPVRPVDAEHAPLDGPRHGHPRLPAHDARLLHRRV